ncbi:hypothetical protein SVI_1586 [Shewanella violacea DSS12]|uniref:Uncharacterized protein n=1 Tax=Shewanella violacea (strain JCM 10179 / CIP 106290 / LMG 19151 / DSS12) TaxID=637905 RepID=D4ZIQ8_SHEVD|nr:hypothetical protein SVI_1586 [Shewanella violacea DSS12]
MNFVLKTKFTDIEWALVAGTAMAATSELSWLVDSHER